MEDDLLGGLVAKNSAFNTAILIYTRLRRVTGRVVDASYLSENIQYAQHVDVLIQSSGDAELLKYIEKLKHALGFSDDFVEEQSVLSTQKTSPLTEEQELEPSYQATEEEVYQAQVSHHYIGSLR